MTISMWYCLITGFCSGFAIGIAFREWISNLAWDRMVETGQIEIYEDTARNTVHVIRKPLRLPSGKTFR